MTRNKLPPVRNGVGASSVTLPNRGEWATVLDYLIARFPSIAASTWQMRFASGLILDADGQAMSAAAPFRGQARVYYYRDLVAETHVPFEAKILFQDEYLLVADKPHFLSVMPAGRYVQETLLVRLKRATGIGTLSPMHRIDRETAGLVVFVIQPETRGAYQSLFHNHQVEKHYEAIAPLRPVAETGIHPPFVFPMRYRAHLRESSNFMQMEVVTEQASNSETEIELLAADPDSGLGHYRLTPVTGKKHQLRVHMNALGIPIVNDAIYPVHRTIPADDFTHPLQLLAKFLAFVDPITGVKRCFESAQSLSLSVARRLT